MSSLIHILFLISLGVLAQKGFALGADEDIRAVDPYMQQNFERLYNQYERTGIASPQLKKFFKNFSFKTPLHFYEDTRNIKKMERIELCSLCKTVVSAVLKNLNEGQSLEELKEMVFNLCKNLKIETEAVCRGAVDLNADIFYYIIQKKPELTADDICGTIFQSSCPTKFKDWTVKANLGPKPKAKPNESAEEEPLVIVQMSDFHTDFSYTEGSLAACDEPLCCQASNGVGTNESNTAGKWGSYHSCDIPFYVSENAVKEVKKQFPKIDAVYVTGDYINHLVWKTTRPGNIEVIKKTFDMIKTHLGDVPVFPILGNHESNPLNQYAPMSVEEDEFSTRWLYELVAEEWSALVGTDISPTIVKGGYYTALLKPGLRVVVLNNNVCYTYNWWLLLEREDLGGHLQWLTEILLEAEANNEKVHLLTHIPPGQSDCLNTWTREFHNIIERFENTVAAQFNGHTHNDHFNLFYSATNITHVFNVAFNGGSVTTFSDMNPNFKVYTVDPVNGNVLDQESWIYNVTKANLNSEQEPEWFKLYSFKEVYGVESMSLDNLGKLVSEYAKNQELMQKYYRFFYKNSDVIQDNTCDVPCAENLLCNIVQSNNLDNTQCERIKDEITSNSS